MSGFNTPSRRLSRIRTRGTPPIRANAVSCNSAQVRVLEREDDQPDTLAAIAERQHKQAGAAVRAGLRIANHGAFAVVDLRFFAGRRDDDGAGLFFRRAIRGAC